MQKLIYLGLSVLLFSGAVNAQTVHGVFRVVKGDVQVFSKSGSSAKAKIGQKVFPSDRIKAGVDSRAKIVMVDKNELNISPDSEIVIENYQYKPEENKKNVLINVLYGKVRAKVEQKYDEGENKFQVKTPTAVAGVRGTDFITGYNKKERTTQIVTFHGKVAFGLPGPNGSIANAVMVGVGQTSTMNGKVPPPPPVEIPKSDLQQMDNSSNASTGTGSGATTAQGPGAGSAGATSDSGDKKKSEERAPASATPAKSEVAATSPPPPPPPAPPPPPPPPPPPQVFKPPPPPPIVKDIIQTGSRSMKVTVINGGGI